MLLFIFSFFIDEKIDSFFTAHFNNKWWNLVSTGISRSADGDIILGSLLLYNLSGEEAEKDVKKLTKGIIGTAVGVVVLKTISGRKRPEGDYFRFNTSFPSGHVTFASLISTYFFLKDKRTGLFFFPWTLGVGFSRIKLKKHWFTDVLGGIIIGAFAGYLIYKEK